MHFRHLAPPVNKGAATIRRPAAVIVTDYGLGLAITQSDSIAPHLVLPEHDCELATTKSAHTRHPARRIALSYGRNIRLMKEVPASGEMDLKLP